LITLFLIVPMGLTRYTSELDGYRFAQSWSFLPIPRLALLTNFASYGAISLGLALALSLAITGGLALAGEEALVQVGATFAVGLAVTAPMLVAIFTADCIVPTQDKYTWGISFFAGLIAFNVCLMRWSRHDESWLAVMGVSLVVMVIVALRSARVIRDWLR